MIPLKFLVATTNSGKLRDFEFAAAHAGNAVALAPLPGLREIEAPPEDETTFEGNARTKAVYYSHFAPAELVLADDSGLEVDALNGAPGVSSARYAEDSGFHDDAGLSLDARNNACLLATLEGTSEKHRTARYRCALVAARDGVVLATGSGTVEGKILTARQGDGGFGYDPYFLPEGSAASMAELAPEERMRLSHRGRALDDLLLNFAREEGAGDRS
jgi:XTP/dITP diphosphohydrolase